MTTLEKIEAELKKLDERGLKEVLSHVKSYVKHEKRRKKSGPGIMEALRSIKTFQGPPDFSRNLDLYLSGEKRIEDHLPGHSVRRRARKRS